MLRRQAGGKVSRVFIIQNYYDKPLQKVNIHCSCMLCNV